MTDELLRWRSEFPALERSVYMVSHSLGAMPKRAYDHLRAYADLWVNKGINAWEDWLPEVDHAAERVGRIINAPAGSMVMATNVSQIQALVASCLDYTPARNKVVFTALNFPTVSYVWHEERRRGAEIVVVPGGDGVHAPMAQLLEAIDERTLIVPISHVLFRSSAIKDVAAVVARAKSVGAMVLLDCYQSTGTVPVDVTALGVDFACGGSVKWLCGGPGAAYLYVRPDRIAQFRPRTTGWFGHEKPFAFTMPEQRYAPSVWRFMAGTPAVAALYQARAGAEIVAEIGVDKIRAKSLRQTDNIIARCDRAGWKINTPRAATERGGSVCFDFDGSERVARALNATGFLCDWRPQSGIRMSPHFYTTDEEVERFLVEVERLKGEGMKTTPINPRELAAPRGYNNGMLAPAGRMLAIAGQIACDVDGHLVSTDFVAQFQRSLANVIAVLHEAGGMPTDLISLRIYVTDKKLYVARTKEVGAVYRELMGTHYPAMALLQVADLLETGALVEIEGLAVISS